MAFSENVTSGNVAVISLCQRGSRLELNWIHKQNEHIWFTYWYHFTKQIICCLCESIRFYSTFISRKMQIHGGIVHVMFEKCWIFW